MTSINRFVKHRSISTKAAQSIIDTVPDMAIVSSGEILDIDTGLIEIEALQVYFTQKMRSGYIVQVFTGDENPVTSWALIPSTWTPGDRNSIRVILECAHDSIDGLIHDELKTALREVCEEDLEEDEDEDEDEEEEEGGDYYEYSICTHYACAIEYGDFSGHTPEEKQLVERFLARIPEGYDTFTYEDDASFRRCDLSGLFGDGITMRAHKIGGVK